MAAVRPFRGWRYNPELVGDIASVLCPPYDLITPEIQESLKQRNPYNVIHLEAGQGLDWSALVEGQYDAAAGLFDAWMRDGILRQDTEPCYYLLRHSFTMGGEMRTRLGLVACVGLDDYRNLQVLPHEYTEAPAIRDRVALMKSVSANISPIMSVYRDAEKELDPVFQAVIARRPDVDASDDYGGATALWRVRSPDEQESIQRFFHDRPVYLADGHHRYEASRQYQLDRQAEDPAADASELACNYALMTLISFDDPGLVVLPYHRNLRGLADEALARVVAPSERCLPAGTDDSHGSRRHRGGGRTAGPGPAGHGYYRARRHGSQALDSGKLGRGTGLGSSFRVGRLGARRESPAARAGRRHPGALGVSSRPR